MTPPPRAAPILDVLPAHDASGSRAYKKNDQAFMKQKNSAMVRRLVGHGRFDGIETAKVMARLYTVARLHVDF